MRVQVNAKFTKTYYTTVVDSRLGITVMQIETLDTCPINMYYFTGTIPLSMLIFTPSADIYRDAPIIKGFNGTDVLIEANL